MSLKKSVVLSALLPQAESDDDLFEWGLARLAERGLRTAEIFFPFEQAAKRRGVLEAYGMESIYLGAMYQKRNGLHLSSVEEEARQKALAETRLCVDAAAAAGSRTILLTSGKVPEAEEELLPALHALQKSLTEICAYASEKGLSVTLEPGDRTVQARQLIGPTDDALALMSALKENCPNLSLTMDTSHTVQLGENVREALRKAHPFCRHIHLANCILKKGHPLYGDKHPTFSHPEGEIPLADMQETADWLRQLYNKEELTLSFEIICPGEDNRAFMEQILREEDWFFRY